ncbi:MAG: preprotein translocase subunit YajC [Oscillospiraceae bacterium]|nr:preprotein translocase subunit YajC [Oscillospiraceae bacterium]
MLTQLAATALSSTGDASSSGGNSFSVVIIFVVLIALFYFVLIRPENKRKKAAAKMRSELAIGDQITTIGGIVGTVCHVTDDTIVLETGADRVRVEFTRWAVSTKGTETDVNKAR